MHKVVPLKSAQAFHLLRLHYRYTKWSFTNCREKFSLSSVLLMAQMWQRKFCCFLFKTPFFYAKKNKPQRNNLCPAWCEKEGVAREGHRRPYLCRDISHKPYHWHTLEYTPFLLFYVGWSPQIRQHRCPTLSHVPPVLGHTREGTESHGQLFEYY